GAVASGGASAGWGAVCGADAGLHVAFLEESVARRMFPSLDTVTAGLLFPVGRAERVAGGYRLSGRWQFGSRITHCDWVASGAFLYRDGPPEPNPAADPHHSPIMHVQPRQVNT